MFYPTKRLLICILLFCPPVFGQTQIACPSVSDIKQGYFSSWLPLYKEGEELASDQDVEIFKNYVSYFEVARWDSSYLESGHCFYQGDHPILNKIIFAHDAWRPEEAAGRWVWLNKQLAECGSIQVADCKFIL